MIMDLKCAMVYWSDKIDKFTNIFIEYGAIVDIRPLQNKIIGNIK